MGTRPPVSVRLAAVSRLGRDHRAHKANPDCVTLTARPRPGRAPTMYIDCLGIVALSIRRTRFSSSTRRLSRLCRGRGTLEYRVGNVLIRPPRGTIYPCVLQSENVHSRVASIQHLRELMWQRWPVASRMLEASNTRLGRRSREYRDLVQMQPDVTQLLTTNWMRFNIGSDGRSRSNALDLLGKETFQGTLGARSMKLFMRPVS